MLVCDSSVTSLVPSTAPVNTAHAVYSGKVGDAGASTEVGITSTESSCHGFEIISMDTPGVSDVQTVGEVQTGAAAGPSEASSGFVGSMLGFMRALSGFGAADVGSNRAVAIGSTSRGNRVLWETEDVMMEQRDTRAELLAERNAFEHMDEFDVPDHNVPAVSYRHVLNDGRLLHSNFQMVLYNEFDTPIPILNFLDTVVHTRGRNMLHQRPAGKNLQALLSN